MRSGPAQSQADAMHHPAMAPQSGFGSCSGLRLKFLPRILWFIFLGSFLSVAQETGIFLNSRVDKSEITIGEKITYTITVEYPEGGQINLPSVLGNLGNFEVKDYQTSPPEKKNGQISQTWTFVISTFTVGDYILPPQLVEYTPAGDTAKIRLNTEPIAVLVKRTSPETVKDIADITSLAFIKTNSPMGWAVIILLAAAAAAAGLVYWLKRKKRQAKEPPPKPPYEEACDALDKLRGKHFSEQGEQRIYCFTLSEILRRYFSRRFQIDALESTTEEFLEKIQSISLTRAQKDMTGKFCEKTDPIKFASQVLSGEDQQIVFKWVETLVDQTKPRIAETADKPEKGTAP